MNAALPMSAVRDANTGLIPAQGISLQDLAGINEDIKAVVELSRSIGLGAINAGLISNKCNSGSGSSGFAVAAMELRQFSGRLEALMHMMEEAVFQEIAAAATRQKLTRRRNELAKAESKSGRGALLGLVANLNSAIMLDQGAQSSWWKALLSMLRRAEQIAKSGHVTARVARLEAVGGGGLATTMTMATSGIEERVLQALEIVRKLIYTDGAH